MMTKFWAKDKITGEYWKPNPMYNKEVLAENSDGELIVLTDMMREGWSISSLKNHEKTTIAPTEKAIEVEKVKCPTCDGSGETMEIVDHDIDYNSVWESRQCWRCNGTGKVIKK